MNPFFYKATLLRRTVRPDGVVLAEVEFEKSEGISLVTITIPEQFVVHPDDAVYIQWEGFAIPFRFLFTVLLRTCTHGSNRSGILKDFSVFPVVVLSPSTVYM